MAQIVASTERALAEQVAARSRRDGYRTGVLAARVAGRTVHRVAVGQFPSAEGAWRTRRALLPYAPQDAWALRLDGARGSTEPRSTEPTALAP